MILINPSVEIETPKAHFKQMLKRIEKIGRVCYKSEEKMTEDSADAFIKKIIASGHDSVIEHESFSVRFICDRGVTHELVRHRLASFSQESTRYCNYNRSQCTFIIPSWCEIEPGEYNQYNLGLIVNADFQWTTAMLAAEEYYKELSRRGWSPQQARTVLPNSLKTEIVMSANLREWRHVLKLRSSAAAHPQIRELMIPLQNELHELLPLVF